MKIVAMCRGGNCRSVAAKMILQRYLGHEVIAIGADNTNDSTKELIFDWADRIVVMSAEFLPNLKIQASVSHGDICKEEFDYSHKSILLDVGNDIWGDPFHEDLQLRIVVELNSKTNNYYFDITNGKQIITWKVLDKIREYKTKIAARNKKDSAI